MTKIVSFRDLTVWQKAHELTLLVYQATERFPSEERYGLTSQMRRAAVAVPANIAEGFRRRGINDKLRFYNIAESSLEELKYYFILATDLRYLREQEPLLNKAADVSKLLHRFIESTSRRR